MNWDELPDDVKHAIDDHLTTLQAQAFVLALYGLNLRQIGRAMNLAPSTARIHLDAATRNLHDAGAPVQNLPTCEPDPSANTAATSPATGPTTTTPSNAN